MASLRFHKFSEANFNFVSESRERSLTPCIDLHHDLYARLHENFSAFARSSLQSTRQNSAREGKRAYEFARLPLGKEIVSFPIMANKAAAVTWNKNCYRTSNRVMSINRVLLLINRSRVRRSRYEQTMGEHNIYALLLLVYENKR